MSKTPPPARILGLFATLTVVGFVGNAFAETAPYTCGEGTIEYTSCNAGYHLNGGECQECPAGSYCTGGTAAPQECSAARWCPKGSKSDDTPCPENFYCPAGTTTLLACPTVDNNVTGEKNIPTQSGTYSGSIRYCNIRLDAGTYLLRNGDDLTIEECPENSFCPGNSAGVPETTDGTSGVTACADYKCYRANGSTEYANCGRPFPYSDGGLEATSALVCYGIFKPGMGLACGNSGDCEQTPLENGTYSEVQEKVYNPGGLFSDIMNVLDTMGSIKECQPGEFCWEGRRYDCPTMVDRAGNTVKLTSEQKSNGIVSCYYPNFPGGQTVDCTFDETTKVASATFGTTVEAGKYIPATDRAYCNRAYEIEESCTGYTYTTGTAQASCTNVRPGYYALGANGQACDGTGCVDQTPCEDGYYCPDGQLKSCAEVLCKAPSSGVNIKMTLLDHSDNNAYEPTHCYTTLAVGEVAVEATSITPMTPTNIFVKATVPVGSWSSDAAGSRTVRPAAMCPVDQFAACPTETYEDQILNFTSDGGADATAITDCYIKAGEEMQDEKGTFTSSAKCTYVE